VDVVLIHGMYMNAHSWSPWLPRASARGFTCHTPSWPYHEGDPATRRVQVDPRLGRLTFGAITRHLKQVIDALPARPALIGHSVGGLLVQKLVNDGYATAGVTISPAPPLGILSADHHFWRANFPHVNPFAGNRPIHMTPQRFHYTFCNTMSRTDSDAALAEYVVPESRNVPRSTLTLQARIRFGAPHVPLLFIAGRQDHLTPLTVVRRNARAYPARSGQVEFQAFEDRSHFICNQPGWEAVADRALNWLQAKSAGA
jgi:pimeloyl-ACP methyl ester carboxylesterase